MFGEPEGVTVAPEGLERWYWTFRRLQAVEAWKAHGAWIEDRDPDMTPGTRERFEFGREVSAEERETAEENRERYRARMDAILGSEDRKSTRLNSSHANISYAVF